MSDETLQRLFEPFFTTKFTGRGLGLSAVQGIVRGHGGGIALRTELGAGTTIRVLLPESELPAANLQAPRDVCADWSGNGLVLLVDDDQRVRAVTELLLHSLGFEVTAVANGYDAIAEFEKRAEQFTVVMLDLTMPDLGGDQVLRELRRQRPDVPILICSGYSEEEVVRRLGPDDSASFLQKPYPYELLKTRLKRLLAPRPSTEAADER